MPATGIEFETLRGQAWADVLDEAREEVWHRVVVNGEHTGVVVRLGRSPDGRLVCTGLTVGFERPREEVTARGLRAIPLGAILATIGEWVAGRGDGFDSDLHRAITQRMAREAFVDTATEVAGRPAKPGPGGWPAEHFERVARLYREALVSHPRAPVKHLMQVLHTSEPTARRWVKTARDRGLLGTATAGRAGEGGLDPGS